MSAVIGATTTFMLSAVSDLSEILLDGSEDKLLDVIKRTFYCTLAGTVAGCLLGIIADTIFKIKADVVHDDFILEVVLYQIRTLTRCVTTEHLLRFGKDEMRVNEVREEAGGVVEIVDDAVD